VDYFTKVELFLLAAGGRTVCSGIKCFGEFLVNDKIPATVACDLLLFFQMTASKPE